MLSVLIIVLALLVAVVVGGLVLVFVAFPGRGQDVPGAPWLTDAMNRAADALPTLGAEPTPDASEVTAQPGSVLGAVLDDGLDDGLESPEQMPEQRGA